MRSTQALLARSISAMRALEKVAQAPGGPNTPIPPSAAEPPVPVPAPAATSAGPMPYTGPNQSTVRQAQNIFKQNPGAQGPMGMGSMWSLLKRVFGMFSGGQSGASGGGYGIGATHSTPATQAEQSGAGPGTPLPPSNGQLIT
jgi:hypothetical protein